MNLAKKNNPVFMVQTGSKVRLIFHFRVRLIRKIRCFIFYFVFLIGKRRSILIIAIRTNLLLVIKPFTARWALNLNPDKKDKYEDGSNGK